MDDDTIIEKLEKLGYSGQRLKVMLDCLKSLAVRKAKIECGELTASDIAIASIVFDAFCKVVEA